MAKATRRPAMADTLRQAVRESGVTVADGMASAADTLGYLSRRGKSQTIRLGASRAILELGNKLREAVELETRIAALEAGQRRTR